MSRSGRDRMSSRVFQTAREDAARKSEKRRSKKKREDRDMEMERRYVKTLRLGCFGVGLTPEDTMMLFLIPGETARCGKAVVAHRRERNSCLELFSAVSHYEEGRELVSERLCFSNPPFSPFKSRGLRYVWRVVAFVMFVTFVMFVPAFMVAVLAIMFVIMPVVMFLWMMPVSMLLNRLAGIILRDGEAAQRHGEQEDQGYQKRSKTFHGTSLCNGNMNQKTIALASEDIR